MGEKKKSSIERIITKPGNISPSSGNGGADEGASGVLSIQCLSTWIFTNT